MFIWPSQSVVRGFNMYFLKVDWFFSDDKDASLRVPLQLSSCVLQQEPTSNIDHLLANVGRIPGDASGKV